MNSHDVCKGRSALPKYCLYDSKRSVRWRKKAFLILPILLFPLFGAWAQNSYAVHANIIYRFTKYINWPDDKKSGDFVIGVIGDTPLFIELQDFTSKTSPGGQPIVIKTFPVTASSFNSHILFVCDEERDSVKRVVSSTGGMPTLLVTESEGLSRKGACINLFWIMIT